MSDSHHVKQRDVKAVLIAVALSAGIALVVGGGAFLWSEIQQTREDNAALANQVRSLGGQPVAEGKPGEKGPPGSPGVQGPIGVTGQSPQCLLEPSKCVGPKGATGSPGQDGSDGETGPAGQTGDTGATGAKGDQGLPGRDGVNGVDGKDGADGRGIKSVTCQDGGDWLITYTDDTTSTTPGCRAPALKIGN